MFRKKSKYQTFKDELNKEFNKMSKKKDSMHVAMKDMFDVLKEKTDINGELYFENLAFNVFHNGKVFKELKHDFSWEHVYGRKLAGDFKSEIKTRNEELVAHIRKNIFGDVKVAHSVSSEAATLVNIYHRTMQVLDKMQTKERAGKWKTLRLRAKGARS